MNDFYKSFRQEYKDIVSYKNISYRTFSDINKDFWNEIVDLLLHDNFEYTVPYRLGTIRLATKKIRDKRLVVDFGYYRKTGQVIYHYNEHSDNKFCYYLWNIDKKDNLFLEKGFYKFQMVRSHKRRLAKEIKEGLIKLNF